MKSQDFIILNVQFNKQNWALSGGADGRVPNLYIDLGLAQGAVMLEGSFSSSSAPNLLLSSLSVQD